MRAGLAEAVQSEMRMAEALEREQQSMAFMQLCTQEELDELEYRMSVGVAEAAKWTDHTYQMMQFI